MPTYDYRCNACGHEFEHFQSITSPVMRKCPVCGKLKLERLIGIGAGIIFKGGGFYETDYRGESYRKAAEADRTPSEGSGDAKDSPAKDGVKSDGAKSDGTKNPDAVPAPHASTPSSKQSAGTPASKKPPGPTPKPGGGTSRKSPKRD